MKIERTLLMFSLGFTSKAWWMTFLLTEMPSKLSFWWFVVDSWRFSDGLRSCFGGCILGLSFGSSFRGFLGGYGGDFGWQRADLWWGWFVVDFLGGLSMR